MPTRSGAEHTNHEATSPPLQRVVLDGISSNWSDVSSGVPQGSILGPLFFIIFISDLPEVVLPGSTIALYADDCKYTRVIDMAGNLKLFQQDLDSLQGCQSDLK